MRIGYGVDIHPLVFGRKLILGGIEIPFNKGVKGHSDGDALIHAIVDAILGALGLGDIGQHFSDKDPQWKDCSSIFFLEKCCQYLNEKNYQIQNIDSVVMLEKPKLSSFMEPMKECMCRALNISTDQLNIKATTEEGLGYIGKGNGVQAQAVVLIIPTT